MSRAAFVWLLLVVALSACRSGSGSAVAPKPAEDSGASASSSAEPASSSRSPSPPPTDSALAVAPSASALGSPSPPKVETDWCIEGLTALDEATCYVLPPLAAGKPRRLLVYLHGIVPPLATSPQKEKVEQAVLHASVRAGAAALVPRGRRGIGPEGARDWWAWPTAPKAHAEYARTLVAQWISAKARLEAIAGAPFDKTFLAGSSNGAYFVSALAMRGEPDALGFPIDGFGAMSGGASGGVSVPAGRPRPFYVGFGSYDEDSKKGARSLVAAISAGRWPSKVAEHPFGHGAREIYLDEAFVFWDLLDHER